MGKIEFIERSVPDYIEKGNWPAKGCDLNPLDYAIWGVMDARVYKNIRAFETILKKASILEVWNGLSQRLLNNSIDQWRPRLQKVVDEEGGHVEQYF